MTRWLIEVEIYDDQTDSSDTTSLAWFVPNKAEALIIYRAYARLMGHKVIKTVKIWGENNDGALNVIRKADGETYFSIDT